MGGGGQFVRAHLIEPKKLVEVRPIVAKFELYAEREEVRKTKHVLAETIFEISQNIPVNCKAKGRNY